MQSRIKKISKKQEAESAKLFGGRVQPASGALATAKGDVRTKEFLIENKYTEKEKYALKYEILDKIWKEAVRESRVPLLELYYKGKEKYYIIIEINNYIEVTGRKYIFFDNTHVAKSKKQITLNVVDMPDDIDEKHLIDLAGKKYIILRREDFIEQWQMI